MSQAQYLFDNQYYPDVVDRVYQDVRNKSWDHCKNIQAAMCRHRSIGGAVTDFVRDDLLNKKMGFPEGSYVHYIPERLLKGHEKYILEHFVRGREMISLKEMLQNDRFHNQFIFHIAEYVFMNLKIRMTQKGTYLIIPIDKDGITEHQMLEMKDSYGNPYMPCMWLLEIQPKTSYYFGIGNTTDLISADGRVYLNNFTDGKCYMQIQWPSNEWKVCVGVSSENRNLLLPSIGNAVAGNDGRTYIQLSDLFLNYVMESADFIHIFLYSDARKAGYTITPNYLGPTGYLKTTFDEYIDTVDARKLKVVAQAPPDYATPLAGFDARFDNPDELCHVGFAADHCWFTIPTKDDVPPVHPNNIRIWEYDSERDIVGRLVTATSELEFPNIYNYTYTADCDMFIIEWYRSDNTVSQQYDDFTGKYRRYFGPEFYNRYLEGNLIDAIGKFKPIHHVFSDQDFIHKVLLESSHDYRVEKIRELFSETGRHWQELVDAIDAKNQYVRTVTFKVAEHPEYFEHAKEFRGDYYWLDVPCADVRYKDGYDIYVDGVHMHKTFSEWLDFRQRFFFERRAIHPNSVIIIDIYEQSPETSARIKVYRDANNAIAIPPNMPMEYMCGNDIVVATQDGTRVHSSQIHYGLHAEEIVVDVPVSFFDLEAMGIRLNDLVKRGRTSVGVDADGKQYQMIRFRQILPTSESNVYLRSIESALFRSNEGQAFTVKHSDLIVTTEEIESTSPGHFSRKLKTEDLRIIIRGIEEPTELVITNANTFRQSEFTNLGFTSTVSFHNFRGSDDPSRLLCFVDGRLMGMNEVEGQIPTKMGDTMEVVFNGSYMNGQIGMVEYLPFPTDRFDISSNEIGLIDLRYSGIGVIGKRDLIFADGLRVDRNSLQFLSNQVILAPEKNTRYTIVRPHRDSNIFGVPDDHDSIDDRMMEQDLEYYDLCLSEAQEKIAEAQMDP